MSLSLTTKLAQLLILLNEGRKFTSTEIGFMSDPHRIGEALTEIDYMRKRLTGAIKDVDTQHATGEMLAGCFNAMVEFNALWLYDKELTITFPMEGIKLEVKPEQVETLLVKASIAKAQLDTLRMAMILPDTELRFTLAMVYALITSTVAMHAQTCEMMKDTICALPF